MKKLFLLLTLGFLFRFFCFSQFPAKYFVQFKNKDHSSYSIEHPEQFLSPRAVQNRQRHNITITESDLPVNEEYIKQVTSLDDDMLLLSKTKWLNGITVYSQKDSILQRIIDLPCVLFCEKTISMSEPEPIPTHPFVYYEDISAKSLRVKPYTEIDYGQSVEQLEINNIQWLHRLGYTGDGMVMAVLDGGFKNVDTLFFFDSLRADHRLLGAKNFVMAGEDPFTSATHGTMVLSCIASFVPAKLVGSAPSVSVYLAKTEDGRSENKIEEDNWVAGVEWADSLGCLIVSSSVGYTSFDDSLQVRDYSVLNGNVSRASRAATIAATKGMIICNSAGNEGKKKWKFIGCPADAKDIITVGAVNKNEKRASFSSYGPTADGRIKPEASAMGVAARVGHPNGNTVPASGTSFAQPLIAGMIACLWQAFPDKSNYEVMTAVRESGNRAAHPDNVAGFGITDMLKAYNLLRNPQSPICFDSLVTNNNRLSFKINNAANDVKIVLRAVNVDKAGKASSSENCKLHFNVLNDGTVKMMLPKLLRKVKYRFCYLSITLNENTEKWLLIQKK